MDYNSVADIIGLSSFV